MPPTAPSTPQAPALEIRELFFRYGPQSARGLQDDASLDQDGSGAFALRLNGLTLDRGDQLLLTGGSGTGKSTLLQLIAGLMEPASGTVMIGGTPMHALHGAVRDRFRGQQIGMIFQTFQLVQGFSAIENVLLALLFGDPPAARVGAHRTRAAELLDALAIDRPDAMVETLSVGQQQRVAVARALACRPALVLADEPTASLDPANAAKAVALIRATARDQGSALLFVSHDPSLVTQFDRRVDLAALVEQESAS
ncbi:MAG: ATP-binding cassette domain-containing protein [Phycisphaerae bacterium]|nr:ATP-binding cassette domain-containing protein [Phycisphaerae bacterium]